MPDNRCARQAALRILGAMELASAARTRGDLAEEQQLLVVACESAEALVPVLPQDHAAVLAKQAYDCRQRLRDVIQAREIQASAVGQDVQTKKQLVHVDFPAVSFPCPKLSLTPSVQTTQPPRSTLLRPFWLLKRLAQLMQHGGWITGSVRIEKTCWLRDGIVQHIPAKIKLLSSLSAIVAPVASINFDHKAALAEGLLSFFVATRTIYATYAVSTGDNTIPGFASFLNAEGGASEGKLSRLWNKGKSLFGSSSNSQGQSSGEPEMCSQESYVAWAGSVAAQLQIFERLIEHFGDAADEAANRVNDLLHRISLLLYCVPCTFMLQDMWLVARQEIVCQRDNYLRLLNL